jgi:hypothetical protein
MLTLLETALTEPPDEAPVLVSCWMQRTVVR